MSASVSGALRQFLPAFLDTAPPLSPDQRRALWAITHCRTPALGGQAFACEKCGHVHFAWHSSNHKACPQCGRQATHDWVERELAKRVDAPCFLVSFTLPAQLRECFLGPQAKQAFDLFFGAVSGALAEQLAAEKGLHAHLNGFTAVLHTWNQRLLFHPHIHCLVPGAGLDAQGQLVRVHNPKFLLPVGGLLGSGGVLSVGQTASNLPALWRSDPPHPPPPFPSPPTQFGPRAARAPGHPTHSCSSRMNACRNHLAATPAPRSAPAALPVPLRSPIGSCSPSKHYGAVPSLPSLGTPAPCHRLCAARASTGLVSSHAPSALPPPTQAP